MRTRETPDAGPRSWRRLWLLRLASMALGFVPMVLALELLMRLLPVSDGFHSMPVNAASPVAHFEPDRDSTWSNGWRFDLVNHVHTNNFGFVNDLDYQPDAGTPLLAIVGDSYVQAASVPWPETAPARLERGVEPQARVYSFGVSGAPLSQYLVFAEFARDVFHPDALVVMVAGNDFDESLHKYKSSPGFHYFVEGKDGELVLERVDFSVGLPRRLVRHSALAMYLVSNLGVQKAPARIGQLLSPRRDLRYVANTSADASPQRVADSRRAIRAFLRELPARSGLDPARVLFVVDAMRPDLYDPRSLALTRGSFVQLMRDDLIGEARARGHEVVDLQEVFAAHYARHGQRFEHETENHWSALGHQVVAEAIRRSRVFRDFEQRIAAPAAVARAADPPAVGPGSPGPRSGL